MLIRDLYRENIRMIDLYKNLINNQCRSKFIGTFAGIQRNSNWTSMLTDQVNQEFDIENIKALNTLNLQDNNFTKLLVLETIMGPFFIEGILECSAYLSNFKIPFRYNISEDTFLKNTGNKRLNIGIKKVRNADNIDMIYLAKVDFEKPFLSDEEALFVTQCNALLFTLFNPDFCLNQIRTLLTCKGEDIGITPYNRIEVNIMDSDKLHMYDLPEKYLYFEKDLEESVVGTPLFYLYKPGNNNPNFWVSMDNSIVLEEAHFQDIFPSNIM